MLPVNGHISCESPGSTPEGQRLVTINVNPQAVDIFVVGYQSFPSLDAAIRRVDPTFNDSIRKIDLNFSNGKDCRQALSDGRIGACMSALYSAKMHFIGVKGAILDVSGTAGVEVIRNLESHVRIDGGISSKTTFLSNAGLVSDGSSDKEPSMGRKIPRRWKKSKAYQYTPDLKSTDDWEILGLKRGASESEIKDDLPLEKCTRS